LGFVIADMIRPVSENTTLAVLCSLNVDREGVLQLPFVSRRDH
jgi:hypothetical protein